MNWNLSVMFFLYHFIHIIVEWSWLFNSLKAVLNSFRKSLKNLQRKSLKNLQQKRLEIKERLEILKWWKWTSVDAWRRLVQVFNPSSLRFVWLSHYPNSWIGGRSHSVLFVHFTPNIHQSLTVLFFISFFSNKFEEKF